MTLMEPNEQLLKAAETGDVVTLESLFAQDHVPDIAFEDKTGRTALIRASQFGHPLAIEYLVGKGASLRHSDDSGRTAAHHYCQGRHHAEDDPTVLRMLMGQDRTLIDKTASDNMTCLVSAVMSSKPNLVCWLLDVGADPNIKDQFGNTPWAHALWRLVSAVLTLRSFLAEREKIIDTCRAFILRDVRSRDADDLACPVEHSVVRDQHVYRLEKPSVLGLFVLFEQSLNGTFSEQTRRVIRQEFCSFISTTTGLAYREPSCVFDHHDRRSNTSDASNTATPPRGDSLTGGTDDVKESSPVGNQSPDLESGKIRPPVSTPDPDPTVIVGAKGLPSLSTTPTPPETIEYLSLVMPFIYPADSDVMDLQSIAMKQARGGIGKKCKYCVGSGTDLHGFHGPLTLDEYCYPVLPPDVLACRNKDQVLARVKNRSRWNLHMSTIMVDQAWVWQTRDALVYTTLYSTPQLKTSSPHGARSNRYWDIGVYLADLINSTHLEDIFHMFQIAIVELAEEVGEYLKQTGVESIGIQDEKRFYHQINDIREELSMLLRILSQQEEVWREFASNAWPDVWADSQDGRTTFAFDPQNVVRKEDQRALIRLIMLPKLRIQKAQRRIHQLDEDAERVERSVATQLDLKQKHASLQEAHATAVMSTAVFGFTVITIIFTPLSFVMSLFALPIDRLQGSQVPSRWDGGGGMYSTRYIGIWTATAEIVTVAVTFAAMWLALEYGLKYPVTRKTCGFLKSICKKLIDVFRHCARHLTHLGWHGKQTASETRPDTVGQVKNV